MLRRLLLALCALILMATPAAADLAAGIAAYERGDYEAAFAELEPLAKTGNVRAQVYLGLMYREGRGVPEDFYRSAEWYRSAVLKGHDTQYSPSGESVNPREDFTYSDADHAVGHRDRYRGV